MKLLSRLLLLATVCALFAACTWRATDRRWVSDHRFKQVWEQYERLGSVDDVRALLEDQPWRPGEINECLYRINQLARAQELYGPIPFPPRAEPKPGSSTEFRLR
jgi:hypothetical protein